MPERIVKQSSKLSGGVRQQGPNGDCSGTCFWQRATKAIAFSLLLLCSGLGSAFGQTSGNYNITLLISPAIEITFTTGGTVPAILFTNINNYANGVTVANAATIQVRSNLPYTVTVRSETATFSSSSPTVMPVAGVLHVKRNIDATFLGITNTDKVLFTQTRGTKLFPIDYRATPGYNYDGGNYTVSLIYTATHQ